VGESYRYMRAATMKTQIRDIIVRRLDERRYALAVDVVVRYVGSEEECQRRLAMLAPKKDRADQDKALARLGRITALTVQQTSLLVWRASKRHRVERRNSCIERDDHVGMGPPSDRHSSPRLG